MAIRTGCWASSRPTCNLFGAADGSTIYLLGADRFGRDLLSRIIIAMRVSLTVGLLSVAVPLAACG